MSQALGVVGTRIIDFNVSDTRPVVGQLVKIMGRLEEHTPVLCWWNASAGKTVAVYADGEIGACVTGNDGTFSINWTPTAVGQYVVKAVFPGDAWLNGCTSQEILVTVISEEEKAAEEQRLWAAVAIVGIIAVAAVAGVAVYMEESRRTEMLLAALR